MFTQFLGTAATVYGVLGALKTLLQARQMLARRSSGEVSAGFLASYVGGYAIWLAYGLSTGSLPLVVVDTVGCSSARPLLTTTCTSSTGNSVLPGAPASPARFSAPGLEPEARPPPPLRRSPGRARRARPGRVR